MKRTLVLSVASEHIHMPASVIPDNPIPPASHFNQHFTKVEATLQK